MAVEVTSAAFSNQGTIPRQYTCDAQDASPPLAWTGTPDGAKSLALISDDPDAPAGTWVHWVLYNLPPESAGLEENLAKTAELPNGARQGMTDFRRVGYGGPCPPPGKPHRYFFKVYALDQMLDLPENATKADVEQAMRGHILAQGELVGLYGR